METTETKKATGKTPRCPDCGSPLMSGNKLCRDCGWKETKATVERKRKVHDGQCDFRADGCRCPACGSMSHGIKGEGPWYCGWHFKHKGDVGKEIMRRLIKDGTLVIEYKAKRRPAEVGTRHIPKAERAQSVAAIVDKILKRA